MTACYTAEGRIFLLIMPMAGHKPALEKKKK